MFNCGVASLLNTVLWSRNVNSFPVWIGRSGGWLEKSITIGIMCQSIICWRKDGEVGDWGGQSCGDLMPIKVSSIECWNDSCLKTTLRRGLWGPLSLIEYQNEQWPCIWVIETRWMNCTVQNIIYLIFEELNFVPWRHGSWRKLSASNIMASR